MTLKFIDLTLPISEKIPTFPGSPQPVFIQWENIKNDGYNLELLFLSSHTGTHLDAPYHFLEKGKKIHEIPLKRLVIDAILVKIRKSADQPITKTDIQKFENMPQDYVDMSVLNKYNSWSCLDDFAEDLY